jgi:Zn-dependent protease with chaperone function
MLRSFKQLVLIALTAAALAAPAISWAAVVRFAAHTEPSKQVAARVADVLEHLLQKNNMDFHGEIRLTQKTGFLAEAFFGSPGHVLLGESYAAALNDGELAFVLAHELAHLMSDHKARLATFYAKRDSANLADPSSLHHELEMDADRQGLQWAMKAGYAAKDAATALERAYKGAEQAFATHPAVAARTSALLARR